MRERQACVPGDAVQRADRGPPSVSRCLPVAFARRRARSHEPERDMGCRSGRAFIRGVISIAAATIAQAQQASYAAPLDDWAKQEYATHCAVCHGPGGKGDGIFAAQLKSGTVPDLTG